MDYNDNYDEDIWVELVKWGIRIVVAGILCMGGCAFYFMKGGL